MFFDFLCFNTSDQIKLMIEYRISMINLFKHVCILFIYLEDIFVFYTILII